MNMIIQAFSSWSAIAAIDGSFQIATQLCCFGVYRYLGALIFAFFVAIFVG